MRKMRLSSFAQSAASRVASIWAWVEPGMAAKRSRRVRISLAVLAFARCSTRVRLWRMTSASFVASLRRWWVWAGQLCRGEGEREEREESGPVVAVELGEGDDGLLLVAQELVVSGPCCVVVPCQ